MYHKIYNPVHNKYYDIWNRNGIQTLQNYLLQSKQNGGATAFSKGLSGVSGILGFPAGSSAISLSDDELNSKSLEEIVENYKNSSNFEEILERKLKFIDEDNLKEIIEKQEKYKKDLRDLRNKLSVQGVNPMILNIINPFKEPLKISVKKEQAKPIQSQKFPIIKSVYKADYSDTSSTLYDTVLSTYNKNNQKDEILKSMNINYGENTETTFTLEQINTIWSTSFINKEPTLSSEPFQIVPTAGDGNCGYHSIIQSLIEAFYVLGNSSSDILKKFIRHLVIMGYNPNEIVLGNLKQERIVIPREIINYFRVFVLEQRNEEGQKFLPNDPYSQPIIRRLKGGIKSIDTRFITNQFWLHESIIISIVKMFDVPILAYLKSLQQDVNKFLITGNIGTYSDCKMNPEESKEICKHIIFMFNNDVHFTYLKTNLSNYHENIRTALTLKQNSINEKYQELQEKEKDEKEAQNLTLKIKQDSIEEWDKYVNHQVDLQIQEYLNKNYTLAYLFTIPKKRIEDEKAKIKGELMKKIPFRVKYSNALESKEAQAKAGQAAIERSLKESEKAEYIGKIAKETSMVEAKKELEEKVEPEIQNLNVLLVDMEKQAISKFLKELKSKTINDFENKLREEGLEEYIEFVKVYINKKLIEETTIIKVQLKKLENPKPESFKFLKEKISEEIISSNLEAFKKFAKAKVEAKVKAEADRKAEAEAKAKAEADRKAKAEAARIAKAEAVRIARAEAEDRRKAKAKADREKFVEDIGKMKGLASTFIHNLQKLVLDGLPINHAKEAIKQQILDNKKMSKLTPDFNSGTLDANSTTTSDQINRNKFINGLQNYGVTCYFNALLSSLFHLPMIRKLQDPKKSGFISEFVKFKNEYLEPGYDKLQPINLLNTAFEYVKPNRDNLFDSESTIQHDPDEAFSKLINFKDCSVLQELFTHTLQTILECKNDPKITRQGQDETMNIVYWDINEVGSEHTYNVINNENLTGIISSTLHESRWNYDEDLYCQPFLYQNRISQFPHILAIMVKRNQGRYKIMSKLNFEHNIKIGDNDYKLFSVILHGGTSINSGHYVSRVLFEGKIWFECNDLDTYQVEGPSDSSEDGRQITMLFYQNMSSLR